MTMTRIVTEVYCVVADMADPERPFDWHVNYVEVKTYDDGFKRIDGPYQASSAKAVDLGLKLPDVLADLNMLAKAEADRVRLAYQRLEEASDARITKLADDLAAALAEVDKANAATVAIAASAQQEIASLKSAIAKLTPEGVS